MRNFRVGRSQLLIVAFVLAPAVSGADYGFTTVADSTDPMLGGVAGSVQTIQAPTLNESGVVAFSALVDVGNPAPSPSSVTVVYRGDAGGATAVTSPAGPLFPLADIPGLNDAGQLAFMAQLFDGVDFQETEVHRADPGGSIVGIAGPPIFDGVNLTALPRVAGNGDVFFVSQGAERNGVYAGNGSETVFGDYSVVEEDVGAAPRTTFHQPVGVSEAGVVAYVRALGSGTLQIVRADPGGPVVVAQPGDPISDQPGQLLLLGGWACVNARGDVAFLAALDTNVVGIFVADGTSIRTAADTNSGGFDDIDSVIGLNAAGSVAFEASRSGVLGLYLAKGGAIEEVVAEGDSFEGSSVSGFSSAPPALNDAHQVVFTLGLSSGRQVVVRADPLQAEAVPSLSSGGRVLLALLIAVAGWAATRNEPETGPRQI